MTSSKASHVVDRSSYWNDDFRPLQDAGKIILTKLRNDEQQGDLYRRILAKTPAVTTTTSPSVSSGTTTGGTNGGVGGIRTAADASGTVGFADSTAPAEQSMNDPAHHYFPNGPVDHAKSIPLPPYLQGLLATKLKISTTMGLFPQAEMAWMTIDDTVYLWTYNISFVSGSAGTSSRDPSNHFLEFQVPSRQPIISVGLAPPKPGVFNQKVKWCLVVTTKEEAALCVIAKRDLSVEGSTWEVDRTSFVIPSDWVSFLCVAATRSGRVFLGGQDGNLYELDYDLLSSSSTPDYSGRSIVEQLDRFYDGSDDVDGGPAVSTACPTVLVDKSLPTSWLTSDRILQTGKRVLEATLPVTAFGGSTTVRRRKCRKLNHSQSSFMEHIMPDFITKVARGVFGDSTTTGGGAITQIVIDEERQILYTLSSPRGWICAIDLVGSSSSISGRMSNLPSSSASPSTTHPLSVSAVVDAPATARMYLEAVSRGRLFPPQTQHSSRLGMLSFLGNGDAAQAGVGGMEGARRILKILEANKLAQRNNKTKGRGSHRQDINILTPVAIEVVPNQESTRITLVAITSGGLRYYLSTLNQQTVGAGPSTPPYGTPRHKHPWKPHSRFTLCHVRAPPPLSSNEQQSNTVSYADGSTGMAPTAIKNWKVDASFYRMGTFMVAFEPTGQAPDGTPRNEDLVVAATADCAARIVRKTYSDKGTKPTVSFVAPGGVCELISFAASSADSETASGREEKTTTLSGGRVWEIKPATFAQGKVLTLALHSRTPSDMELGVVIPPYVPSDVATLSLASKSQTADTSAAPVTNLSTSVVSFRVFTNVLLGRPAGYGIVVRNPMLPSVERGPLYRISVHSGSDGFSLSAANVASNGRTTGSISRSERLSPWLMHPDVTPLHPLALQHLQPQESTLLALNIGGVHSFQSISLMGQLSRAISAAGTNARSDTAVTKFFQEYGYDEGCAMCLMLAIMPNSTHELKEWAIRAALHRAFRPRLVRVDNSMNGDRSSVSVHYQAAADDWIPADYNVKLSSLCEGLYLTLARLLRPIWHKPAVVVTEGRIVKRGATTITTPAKVELLLDDDTIEEIRRPLFALEVLVRQVFQKAIESVPLKTTGKSGLTDADPMEIEGDDSFFRTRSMQFQRQGQINGFGHANAAVSDADSQELAQHIEERNIHALYRLLSRTTQLLSLLSYLRRAQVIPDLPDVEWGLLHGVQVMKLVQTLDGQERIENLLNKLVTLSQPPYVQRPGNITTADANQLAELLSQQCFHYFSPAARYAYLGYRTAQEALYLPEGQTRRLVRTQQAIEYLNEAAKNWFSSSLVTGCVLHGEKSEKYDAIARRAIQSNSPLAEACTLLVKLGDAAAIVTTCLLTAANFLGGRKSARNGFEVVDSSFDQLSWEKGLYHKRQELNVEVALGSQKTMVQGAAVTNRDAVKTCYALVFYFLTRFLDAGDSSDERRMGEEMVSACAFSSDETFLEEFYEHMWRSNRKDVLLRVKSHFLEKWLTRKQEEDHELLLLYYRVQGMKMEEADVAWKLATSFGYPEMRFDLDKRIEFLATAVTNYSTVLASGRFIQSHSGGDIALTSRNVKDRFELAKLQRRVLLALESTKYEVAEDLKKMLQWSLLDANALYNDFAIPYDMYEICLFILQACHHQESTVTQQLWKNLICSEIFPCETRNNALYQRLTAFAADSDFSDTPNVSYLTSTSNSNEFSLFESGEWSAKLKSTVIRVGQNLLANEFAFVFPVDFIASCLEELRSISGVAAAPGALTISQEWTFAILISVGISFKVAFDACAAVIERENQENIVGANPMYLLTKFGALVSMFEFFLQTARSRTQDESQNDALVEVSAEVSRVKVLLQTIPENVTSLESRLYIVEQEIRDLSYRY